ncbi:hypothetical protein Taro_032931, partial [Colocasia esculenta]|nr:hypothetical protein [Colocasia esculenta]
MCGPLACVSGVCASCEAWWAGHWAQSAHRFCACERDRGLRRDLNATALGVVFLLPLFGGRRLHGCRVSRGGQSVDIDGGIATATSVAIRCGVGWSPQLVVLLLSLWSRSWTEGPWLRDFEVCPCVGTVVIVVGEQRLTGCGLTSVVPVPYVGCALWWYLVVI